MKRATAIRALVSAGAVLTLGGFATRSLLASMQPPARMAAASDTRRIAPSAPVAVRDAGPANVSGAAMVGFTVSNVTGPVERRADPHDAWRPVQPGETIQRNESLRTGSGGAALLELQDHTTVWLWPESSITADRLDDELARVGIAEGRLDLNVPHRDERTVQVAASGGGALATTTGARFSIIVDGAHVATVATREGDVDVVSGNGRVRVPPGMQTRARPGAEPEVVTPIPADLLLAVDWPTTVIRARSTVIRGRAPAGVLVSVGGTRVVVADDGSFEHEVPLAEGENHIDVTAEDVVGRRIVRHSPAVRVDTRPPSVGSHGRWE